MPPLLIHDETRWHCVTEDQDDYLPSLLNLQESKGLRISRSTEGSVAFGNLELSNRAVIQMRVPEDLQTPRPR